jgi:hypothetical protein
LHFPAARDHASAIFVRGDMVWIVLDGHPALDTASCLHRSPQSLRARKPNKARRIGAETGVQIAASPLPSTKAKPHSIFT